MKRNLHLVGVSALLLVFGAATSLPAWPRQAGAKPKGLPLEPALIDLQGYRDILARYRGKPLLVNFWATWCEPCRQEYPMLIELARKYAPEGLVVVGVSLDDDGEITLVRRFLEKYSPVFPNYRKRPGNEEAFINGVQPKWTGAIPATFFYDRNGRELRRLVGEYRREAFEKAIGALLNSSPKGSPVAKSGSNH